MHNEYRAISYPRINPPLDWLRKQLLFYDKVYIIIPKSEVPKIPDEHKEFYDKLNGSVCFSHSEQEAVWASSETVKRLSKGFEQIAQNRPRSQKNAITIANNGDQSIDGYVYLHIEKIDEGIRQLLNDYKLLFNISADKMLGRSDLLIVEEKAADLVVGLIANTLSKRHNLWPITDLHNPFILNSLDDLNVTASPNAESLLMSAILNLQVPSEIESLSIDNYISIRNVYNDLREPFHNFVCSLTQNNTLNGITSTDELKSQVKTLSDTFDSEFVKFKNIGTIKKIISWTSFSLSSLFSFVSTITPPPISAAFSGGSVVLNLVDRVTGAPNESSERYLFNRLYSLNHKILHSSEVVPFL